MVSTSSRYPFPWRTRTDRQRHSHRHTGSDLPVSGTCLALFGGGGGLQMTYYMIYDLGGDHGLSKLEQAALLIGALCHDIAHPGVNNLYQVRQSTPHPAPPRTYMRITTTTNPHIHTHT
jgi:hypothetical protein